MNTHTYNTSMTTPILESRLEIDKWLRMFRDHLRKKNLLRIVDDAEKRPKTIQGASTKEILRIQEKIEDYQDRRRQAFVAICEAMQKDSIIYNHQYLDKLREKDDPSPTKAYKFVMEILRPTFFESQILVEGLINNLQILPNESVPSLIQRLASLIARLEINDRPAGQVLIRRIAKAIRNHPETYEKYKFKLETLLETDPLPSYDTFCNASMRRHQHLEAEERIDPPQSSSVEINQISGFQRRHEAYRERGRAREEGATY
jgi:hypothetical protein